MLRIVNRFLKRCVCLPLYVPLCGLSATETATALRPFYFAVHPDLFGKYPKAREVNENSLKRLNEYLECLHNNQKVEPVDLLFYVRDTVQQEQTRGKEALKTIELFRTVRISLLSGCVRSTVSSILQSCNLPLDYVNSIKLEGLRQSGTAASDRPIKWHHSYYSFYGIPNPDIEPLKHEKTIDTLSSWLTRNIPKARKRQEALQGIRLEIERLKTQLQEESGLVSVEWACGWGLTQFRTSLRGFLRVYRQNSHQLDLKGQSLVFAHDNGVCLRGNIIVKTDDLADSWVPLLKSIPARFAILNKLPGYESVLSHLLNHVCVVRRTGRPIILAEEYLAQLKKLSSSLERYFIQSENHRLTADLREVEVVVECAQGPLHLNNAGQILIPYSCPAFLIVDFLNDNADTARQMKQHFNKKDCVIKDLVKACKLEHRLESLDKEANITCEQMEACCKKLMADQRNIGPSLEGCQIKVAQFYSVMSDGEIYIPWNWKGAYDKD